MMPPLVAAVGLSAVVLQCVLLSFSPAGYALISWVHAACCLTLLMLLHPAISAIQQRRAEYAAMGRNVGAAELLADPNVHYAIYESPPLPPPFEWTTYALGLCVVADYCDGLRVWMGAARIDATHPGPAVLWEGAHELLLAGVAALLFWATRGLGATPSRTLSSACFVSGALAALQLQSLAPTLPALGGGGAAAAVVGEVAAAGGGGLASWVPQAFAAALACRVCACSALAAQAGTAVCGALFPSAATHGVAPLSRPHADLPRWLCQTAGALLLLLPPTCRALLAAPAGGGALALGASRLGMACLTLSAWLALFPAEDEADMFGDGGAGSMAEAQSQGYPSIQAMKEARRAAREAKARRAAEPPMAPLMLESLHRRGGVQGLGWHDSALCRDPDGDEAHDFWEAVSGGCFRRCNVAGAA